MSVTTLNGSNVVVTGVVTGYTRHEAERLLAQHGAHVQARVTQDTDVLIIGAKAGGTKVRGAQKWGTPTIPWSDALALINGAPAVTPAAAPEPPTNVNKPVPPQQGYRQIFPMKCKDPDGDTPEDKLPKSDEWAYEIKWDGYRCIAHVNGKTILQSSGGIQFHQYPHIAAELDELVVPCILDGEIVVLDEDGNSDHARLHAGETDAARYVVFDVLEAQGVDLRARPLRERRLVLDTILEGGTYVMGSPVFDETERDALLEHARDNSLEGIVAKRLNSPYKEKARNGMWLKIKLRLEQEFVIVGWTNGKGNRAHTAGAFLLAVNDGTKTKPKWSYVGDVGSGGTIDEIEEIRASLTPSIRAGKPWPTVDHNQFTKAQLREITFVKPEVVLQVRFQKWLPSGTLWHPSMQGVRTDKTPKEVTRAA